MDFGYTDSEIEKKPAGAVAPPSEPKQAPKIINFESSDEEDDSFEFRGNPIDSLKSMTQSINPLEEFEHITKPIGDFVQNTNEKINSHYNDLISDFTAPAPGDSFVNAGHSLKDKTMDFLNTERDSPVKTAVQTIPEPEIHEHEDNFFEDDSPAVSAHTSPAKKPAVQTTDLDDHFISSEDLLGDFKPKETESVPAKISVLPSVQKKLEEKFSEDAIPTSGIESLNSSKTVSSSVEPQQEIKVISVQKLFAEYGLDIWFRPERLHPIVESLIYWRDVKKSGVVFGAGLVTLLAISCFSVISVMAYLAIFLLTGAIAFRIYKTIMAAIHKTNEGHPFKEYLEVDVTISQEKSQEVCGNVVAHFNGFATELRRLFLVEDLIDSLKFGGILWLLTYIGAWFNGMTLVLLAYVALFTLPKVYENNKSSIDAYLELVQAKISEITDKVRSAVPIGKSAPVESDKDK